MRSFVFSGGFAFLPFLWLVNIFWFFREAFLAPAYTEQSQIKGCEWREACGRVMEAPWGLGERQEGRAGPGSLLFSLYPLADVWRSAVGFLFWVIALTTWITIFQIYRPRWGALGDYLSFTIPLGTP